MEPGPSGTPVNGYMLLIVSIALANFMAAFDSTIVTIALPVIAKIFSLPAGMAGWVITVYVLVFAVSRLRLPTPTISETATDGRTVICQILMNASVNGASTEQRSPKNKPTEMPRITLIWIQRERLSRGSFMGFVFSGS